MGIIAILRNLVRYWWITAPVAVLTLAGVIYVGLAVPRTYESSATYLLLNPQDSTANRSNPFLQLPDPGAMVGALTESLNSPSTKDRLVSQGASEDYEVGPSASYGTASRIIQIYAPGATPVSSLLTTNLVGDELASELKRMQDEEKVAAKSYISLLPLNVTPEAKLKSSSLMRSAMAVVALGVVLTFVLVSFAQARDEGGAGSREREVVPPGPALRQRRRREDPAPRVVPLETPVSLEDRLRYGVVSGRDG